MRPPPFTDETFARERDKRWNQRPNMIRPGNSESEANSAFTYAYS